MVITDKDTWTYRPVWQQKEHLSELSVDLLEMKIKSLAYEKKVLEAILKNAKKRLKQK